MTAVIEETDTERTPRSYLSYDEIKIAYGISADTVRRAVSRGELRRCGTPGRARFAASDVARWFENPVPRQPVRRIYNRDVAVPGSQLRW